MLDRTYTEFELAEIRNKSTLDFTAEERRALFMAYKKRLENTEAAYVLKHGPRDGSDRHDW